MATYIIYQGPRARRTVLMANGIWAPQQKQQLAKRFSESDAQAMLSSLQSTLPGILFGMAMVQGTEEGR
jgi:hypothetical protein